MATRTPHRHRSGVAGLVLLPLIVAAPTRAAGVREPVVTLVGAGATFDKPFFDAAFDAYRGIRPTAVRYAAVGSGVGVARFLAKQVDFGATDVPLTPAELRQAVPHGGPVVQVPVALGAISITYYLPKLPGTAPLHIDGPTLAAIYLGRITRWNDPALAALNPGRHLPAIRIVPVHRSDSSGNTAILTNYLNRVSPAWGRAAGSGELVRWPTGIQGYGDAGVAMQMVHAGTIGYVQLRYALVNRLPYMALRNQAGAFVQPGAPSIRSAAAQFPRVNAAHYLIVNAPGAASYPLAAYSWVLLRQRPPDPPGGGRWWTCSAGWSPPARTSPPSAPTCRCRLQRGTRRSPASPAS